MAQNEHNPGTDYPRQRYELLRSTYGNKSEYKKHDFAMSFFLFGFYGLFFMYASHVYIAEYYHTPSLRWCGKKDPALEVLYDAYRQILFSTNDC